LKKYRFVFWLLIIAGPIIAALNFRAWNDKEDRKEDQVYAEAKVTHRRFLDAREYRAYQLMVEAEVEKAKPFKATMPEFLVRATINEIKNNADDEITVRRELDIIWGESRWNPNAKGRAGEIGLTQSKPWDVGANAEDLLNPIKNVKIHMNYLKKLRVYYAGDIGLAFAHNAEGHTAGKNYARKIMAGE